MTTRRGASASSTPARLSWRPISTHRDGAISRMLSPRFVLATPEGRRLRRPGRLPLVLVGDGQTPRFHDRARGYVSVHGRGSVRALGEALGMGIDDRRFRSNIVIDDAAAWQELAWTGEVCIGDLTFQTAGPIVRCLATHANPDTGVRDAKVLTTLTGALAQQEPTLGRLLLPAGRRRMTARPPAAE